MSSCLFHSPISQLFFFVAAEAVVGDRTELSMLTGNNQVALQVLSQTVVLGKRLARVFHGVTEYAFVHTTDLELLEWICDSFPSERRHFRLTGEQDREIGEQGHAETARLMLSRGYSVSDSMTYGAASRGHVRLLKLLHESTENVDFGCKERMTRAAAADGHLAAVRSIQENRSECWDPYCSHRRSHAIDEAATRGDLEIVKCLHEGQPTSCSTLAMDGAAMNGHLAVVKYLHENRAEGCTSRALDAAVENRHFEVVRSLQENRVEGCSRHAMMDAIAKDEFEN